MQVKIQNVQFKPQPDNNDDFGTKIKLKLVHPRVVNFVKSPWLLGRCSR
jgi:hypothetical protein